MPSVYSVRQVNAYIKNMFSQDFALRKIYVKGEVSNCKYHSTGHIYFTLKDESGILSCIMFAGSRSGLRFRMIDGQKIIVLGSIQVYERGGSYSLYAEQIRLDGMGDLYQLFEEQKKRLAEMGMFAEEYKKPIPRFVRRLGVITAPTGAAVQDIIQIATRRNPHIQIVLYPALVQGEGAAESICRGIECLDALNLDCLIVGRGGGSMEDLWAFNEESVARAIFDCETPILSAVGHQTDYTIADFVSDLRAPTPSAAAELAVFDAELFESELNQLRDRLDFLAKKQMDACLKNTMHLLDLLRYKHPQTRLNLQKERLAQYQQDMGYLISGKFEKSKHLLALYSGKLQALSPLSRISSGYAYVEDESGMPVRQVKNLQENHILTLTFRDGKVKASVLEIEEYGRKEDTSYGGDAGTDSADIR